MPRARSNSLFEKKVTYHRDVASERAELKRQQKLRRDEEKAELRRLEIAERKRKEERRAADAADRKIEQDWKRKGHRNPVATAAALSEAWHGRPAETETEYIEKVRFHGVLTDLGRLMELKVWVSGRHTRAISFDQATRLASNEDGEQLYVVGGDQSLDLGALGIKGHAAAKDLVRVGDIYSVTYHTAKMHLGKADKTPGPYEHVFCEHKQEEPTLVYDALNETVGFAGGEYHIDVDIDGKYSAGIRD